MAVAAYLRVHGANDYHFNNDEMMHLGIARGRSLGDVLHLSLFEVHLPLFYVLLHYWLMLSDDPAVMRGFSLLFGLATIALYYVIGRRLGSERLGLCAAAIVAFGQGCIIQSYLLRHYALFLFLLSCCFYCFIRWREHRGTGALLSYFIFAAASFMTHFSGILAVFCFATAGSLELLRVRQWAKLSVWALANLAVAVMAVVAYHIWEPTLACVKSYVVASTLDRTAHTPPSVLKDAAFYPVEVAAYLFSNPLEALILLILPFASIVRVKALRFYVLLLSGALGLGIVLYATRFYNIASPRHYIWNFPFLIVASGWALARVSGPVIKDTGFLSGILLAGGVLMYNPDMRFSDTLEYQVPQAQWEKLSHFAEGLGEHDLIIANRDDAILLEDVYHFTDDVACRGPAQSVLMPFGKTHILFSPIHRRFFKADYLKEMLDDAKARGWMTGVDRLAFYQTQWARAAEPDFSACNITGKEVTPLWQSNPRYGFVRRKSDSYAKLTLVSRNAFLNEALAQSGAAHSCLNFP